jgi:hypothetical protein
VTPPGAFSPRVKTLQAMFSEQFYQPKIASRFQSG